MRTLLAAISIGVTMTASAYSAPRDLVFDLSEPLVAITADFTGSELLLFGATDGTGDVVVVVRGPLRDQVVRRKDRVSGVWVNREAINFTDVPDYYAVASNRPIDEFISREVRDANQIGAAHLNLSSAREGIAPGKFNDFRNALIRGKQRQGLYSTKTVDLIFLSERLFRTSLRFPANVAVGTYGIDVYLMRNGEVAGVETKLLNFRKVGFEASVYDFAYRHSLAYGFLAVFIAVVAGWLADVSFRRR